MAALFAFSARLDRHGPTRGHRKASETNLRANPWAETGLQGPRRGHRGKMTDFNHGPRAAPDRPAGAAGLRRRECAEWRDERAVTHHRPAAGRRGRFPPLPCRRGSCATAAPRSSAASACPPATAGSRHWPSSSPSPPRDAASPQADDLVFVPGRTGPAPKTDHGVPLRHLPVSANGASAILYDGLRPGRDDRARGGRRVLALGVSGGGPLAALRAVSAGRASW
jgi:hypothetical protein